MSESIDSGLISEHTLSPNIETSTITNQARNTDVGNGIRMVDLWGDRILYCHPEGVWYVWNQKIWKRDDTAEIDRMAKATVRSIYQEGLDADNFETQKILLKHALASESKGRIEAMIHMAKSEAGIVVLPDRFDEDRYLFNVQNGTIDLRTGQLRPHDQQDYMSKISPITYDPNATCPRWLEFLGTIFSGNESLIHYMQRLSGYALTGDTKEEEFDIFYGTGGNGKSKFCNEIAYILGDYFVKANVETVLASKDTKSGAEASADVAALKGARLVIVSEPDKDRELREGRIKDLTGREPITARRLYQEPFTFTPEFKLWLITNHKPRIRSVDKGIWRRVHMDPFTVTIPDDKIDMDLDKKLKTESAGILNWMIQGCLMWQKEGLHAPVEIKEATEDYREEMDWLSDLFKRFCEVDKAASVSNKYLYEYVYKAWCNIQNIKPLSHMAFPQIMQERGFKKRKTVDGIVYDGLKLSRHIIERCEIIESQWGGADYDGLMVMTAFLQNFHKLIPHSDFPEKPSEPSEPSLKPSTDADSLKNNEAVIMTAFPSKPVINTPVTDLTLSLEKARTQYENINGVVNSININNFSMWYCETFRPKWTVGKETGDYTPSGIKAIASKLFHLTPEPGQQS